jgi:hypothetical protein
VKGRRYSGVVKPNIAAFIREQQLTPVIMNNQNNPNNMFKDFYQREDSRKHQLRAYGENLQRDIQAKKKQNMENAQKKFNSDFDYIQGQVNNYNAEQIKKIENKKTSKMELCTQLDEQRKVRGEQQQKRFSMGDAEKKINAQN